MTAYYTLQPHDSLVLRDNRFFGGSAMHSSDWISPSVMAGSVRTVIGKSKGKFDHAELRKVAVAGPFPVQAGQLAFTPPCDLVAMEVGGKIHIWNVKPGEYLAGQGCDLPAGIKPAMLDKNAPAGKPVMVPGFWKLDHMIRWLVNPSDTKEYSSSKDLSDLESPMFEERTHLEVEDSTKAAKPHMLFTCTGLALPVKGTSSYALSVRISDADSLKQNQFIHPVGGERRLVDWTLENQKPSGWECPKEIQASLATAKKVRMVLATPATFTNGWRPDWIDDSLEGVVPGTSVKVKLVSACVPRWKAVSGWSFEQGGPKALRRSAPAGSVYFMEVISGESSELSKAWMQSMSTAEAAEGFGIALWGLWI